MMLLVGLLSAMTGAFFGVVIMALMQISHEEMKLPQHKFYGKE